MQLHKAIILGTVAAQASAVSLTGTKLNGWYPCSENTFSGTGSMNEQIAECAVYIAPLCYPGVCEAPHAVNPTIDVFVKRIPATNVNPEVARNVWMLQGGPGFASNGNKFYLIFSCMVELHTILKGEVNVYTMDHRGTGRSTRLDCVAAQATATGSPWGVEIEKSEVAACANALEFEYEDLASFSMTSAATDLATFISEHSNDESTIVYGVSYGTALVERLIHLAPHKVTGYFLDSIATSSGAGADQFEYVSTWDIDFGEIGDAFMELCEHDLECNTRFKSARLPTIVQKLINQFDDDPNSTCASLMRNISNSSIEQNSDPPSYTLRRALGTLLENAISRTIIPPIVYRLNRCSSDDLAVLKHFFSLIESDLTPTMKVDYMQSGLLYNLIVFSEFWESPSPSISEMEKRFTNAKIGDSGLYSTLSQYCAFSKEDSEACHELGGGNYSGKGIVYKRDQYWNKGAMIPNQASVLLLQGALDPQTPAKYAEYLFRALRGENKELIIFENSTHSILDSTPVSEFDTTQETCGMSILASYVRNDGDLMRIDKSCVEEVIKFNLTAPTSIVQYYLSTEDAYDGVYNTILKEEKASTV
ncbi:Serine protease [Phytophthora megakarya]|uniref:Serine protease n=1 Tax=Phytophthora megakarya TaxID=4795 RepID=A0A225UYW7_9STRA|nr:Serine protease [Phytophthora megakarya]